MEPNDPPRLRVVVPLARRAERQYMLELVLTQWLGLEFDLADHDQPWTLIRRIGDLDNREIAIPEGLFALGEDAWLTDRGMPDRPIPTLRIPSTQSGLRSAGGAGEPSGSVHPTIPAIFSAGRSGTTAWEETEARITFTFDLLGSAFWLLSRYEEAVRPERDAHGRFPATASLAVLEGFEDRAVVDEYTDLLWGAFRSLWPDLERPPTTFRLRLTHDIDQPWAAWGRSTREIGRAVLGDLGRRRDPHLAVRRLRSVVDALSGRVDRDPLNAFDFLMDTSEANGLQSTFYLMAGNAPGEDDFRYRLSDPPFGSILRRIHDRGHQIGLHASYSSFNSQDRLQFEFSALRGACREVGIEQAAWGVRQHYLRFGVPRSWQIQEAAGFAHDSSLGFAERAGFRAGTCREHPVFDLGSGRPLTIREHPLVVMDTTLVEYLGLSAPEADARTRAIVATCRRHGGDAVLLFHNDSLAGDRSRARYRALIDELAAPTDLEGN